ncbi:MAG TPA: MurR/RpiR family transcriptional regulator [Acidimicrobiales bacterium]|jgi:DNA-binding MurR/RpiR family transcriptional regulator|nr:MurR/RpiR family transcriptional regulator [Acidimicrobiales bacterium]
MSVRDRLEERRELLTPSERRVAEVVLGDPEAVAFGTVAELARRAGTGGATVVRLAERLGYEGFTGLQSAVRDDFAGRLRLASQRIRRPAAHDDLASRALAVEAGNLAATFEHLDRAALRRAVVEISRRRARVIVLPGGASVGIARQFCDELAMLRAGILLVAGSPVEVAARSADLASEDVVVAIDLRRYDDALLDAVSMAAEAGATVIAVTDSVLSPLAALADATLVAAVEGTGPFDSHIGVLAIGNALVAGVAARLRHSATERIDRIEGAWDAVGAVVDHP